MKYVVTINSNNYEVEVDRGQATVVKADSAPAAIQQNAAPAAAPATAAAPAAVSSAEGQKLTAPMPGIILDVKKKAGDRINKGDVVVILEAMKMESEITSPFEGTLIEVSTSKGAHVNVGDVLLVIK